MDEFSSMYSAGAHAHTHTHTYMRRPKIFRLCPGIAFL